MTMLPVWHALIYIGDGAVLLPGALLLFAWLIACPATRRTGWWWLLAVLLVCGGVALSKLFYMVSGWHPVGWNFIGLSGHAALSFLFWPSVAALATGHRHTGVRLVAVGVGAVLALAISISSWLLRDHSLSEVVLGALWGAVVAALFLILTWRHPAQASSASNWMIASMLLVVVFAFGHEFPSGPVLGWIALKVTGHAAIDRRPNPGPQARLPDNEGGWTAVGFASRVCAPRLERSRGSRVARTRKRYPRGDGWQQGAERMVPRILLEARRMSGIFTV